MYRRLCVTVNFLVAAVHTYQLCNQLLLHVIAFAARNQGDSLALLRVTASRSATFESVRRCIAFRARLIDT